ncbi:14367_t:CDS:2 [Racocetra persica]|uniref:14367_t:CDS:1 n=1 Tax=Racocetra persica TaxID=160502 RepID=A0ACA9PCF1_9GLOM|nr:14367_t:CDS:2 [Racocetra persica]
MVNGGFYGDIYWVFDDDGSSDKYIDSNTFIVTQKESNINNLNYGGRSYMCVDTGEAPRDDEFNTPDTSSDN